MAWIIVNQRTMEGYRGHNNRVRSTDWGEQSMATHYRDKNRAMGNAARLMDANPELFLTIQESPFACKRRLKTSRYTFADGTHAPARKKP